ncbi:ATP-binding protein [Zobellella sp. DQSA1]|uniref:ATP-binding protein n=1 Tax=Zobellella sp. DQSA1 TaxID=3342386 RepID=UPI0035C00CEE
MNDKHTFRNDSSTSSSYIFRPKARIMVLLGDQLIKNHTLALFELVKNSYDADANKINLQLNDIDTTNGSIEVEDDGNGMDLETIVNVWLEPANSHKADARNRGIRTQKGRLPVGEKGVGRFAVHRLGRSILMITRSQGCKEVVVSIDWDEFLRNEYLDQAEIDIVERDPIVFTGEKTGTKITISNLRQEWKRGDIRRLYRSITSMTPPQLTNNTPDSIPTEHQPEDEFKVNFELCPEKGWLSDLFSPELAISQALFRFDFKLNDDGLSYEYHFTPFNAMKSDYPGLISNRSEIVNKLTAFEFFKKSPPEDGISMKDRKKRSQKPLMGPGTQDQPGLNIGPLEGTIFGFDFDKEIYERYQHDENKGLIDYLRQQGGIRVYRDGLRVYNYGEPGDDWLHLDHRRIQGPTRKLGSRQLLGTLHLNLEDSPALMEKTNREGFVENEAYTELVYAMLCILAQFEAERNKDKRHLKAVLELPVGNTVKTEKPRKKTIEELLATLKTTVLEKEEYKPLHPMVKQVTIAYKETRDVLMSAAGAGLGLVTVFHELERGVRNLHQAIEEETSLVQIKEMSTELVSLLRGAMYMVNTKQMEVLSASKLVEYVLLTQERRFKRHGIQLLNGFENSKSLDFYIKGIRRMLTTALVNLLDNSIYWVDSDDISPKYIWIGPSHELEGPAIVVADSGPGMIDDSIDLVQPFFSRKTDGMGIGLYYSDMAMKSHNGRLAFPHQGAIECPAVTSGACIAMVFSL